MDIVCIKIKTKRYIRSENVIVLGNGLMGCENNGSSRFGRKKSSAALSEGRWMELGEKTVVPF